jgi:RNA polymerase sigma-70 factor, ECF subfamily
MSENAPITLLLKRVARGEAEASDELFAAVYPELRKLAGSFMRRERPGHTLQPTALVNEVYLRMLGSFNLDWTDRAHFFAIAARAMRRILVDHARAAGAAKRSGVEIPNLDQSATISADKLDLILAVDNALTRLQAKDARQASIVELRFFADLTEEEIALIVGVSARTVKRDWVVAKAWFRAELESRAASASSASL